MNFLPTITTTSNSKWKEKVKEAIDLKITEVAVFPTSLDLEQRKKLYSLIEGSTINRVPVVHLRSDMELWEMEYFIKKYNAQVFNVHSDREYPIKEEWLKYKDIICIENTHKSPLKEEEIKRLGGICLDFAHLENDRLTNQDKFDNDSLLLAKYPIKANHIAAIKKDFKVGEGERLFYDNHMLEDLTELDYLKRYPVYYFSDYCALELENKLEKQLEAIAYIKNLLKFRDNFISSVIK